MMGFLRDADLLKGAIIFTFFVAFVSIVGWEIVKNLLGAA